MHYKQGKWERVWIDSPYVLSGAIAANQNVHLLVTSGVRSIALDSVHSAKDSVHTDLLKYLIYRVLYGIKK